mmetsp:Transcript_24430/g.84937  ORF Transcript_24430/g.84937 Transcript_24430/m.84937 type:complete len:332 (+) Transcript_24430:2498-3493(+)
MPNPSIVQPATVHVQDSETHGCHQHRRGRHGSMQRSRLEEVSLLALQRLGNVRARHVAARRDHCAVAARGQAAEQVLARGAVGRHSARQCQVRVWAVATDRRHGVVQAGFAAHIHFLARALEQITVVVEVGALVCEVEIHAGDDCCGRLASGRIHYRLRTSQAAAWRLEAEPSVQAACAVSSFPRARRPVSEAGTDCYSLRGRAAPAGARRTRDVAARQGLARTDDRRSRACERARVAVACTRARISRRGRRAAARRLAATTGGAWIAAQLTLQTWWERAETALHLRTLEGTGVIFVLVLAGGRRLRWWAPGSAAAAATSTLALAALDIAS